MRLDLDPNTEEQRPIKQSFCGSLRRDTHWKCLILSTLITGCLAAIAWCRLTVVTRVVINFYEMPITQTAHASPCDDGYIYIPVAFVVMLYLVYLVECWHSHTRIELQYKVDVNTVYERMQAMREALPVVWWKAVCYHYVRRTRQVTRYRNGDAFTTTQVYYERINSHTARSAFNFSHCGIKDISKNLVNLESYPATKIKFSKGFSFATVEAENEFEDQRAQFFHGHERRDDYMETREGLDLLNVNFKEYMIAFADPDNLPWYVSHIVFWIASILLLSWPLRVCIEYKTAYVHYHVHKLFGCNYLDPSYCPGTMSRVSTMGSSELEMNIRNNYTLVPSYSEALLMENCYNQLTEHANSQDPNGNLTPSSIVNGFIPTAAPLHGGGGMTQYGTLPNGDVGHANGSLPNGNLHLANGHVPSGSDNVQLVGHSGHVPNASAPNSLIISSRNDISDSTHTAGLPNGRIPNGGMPVVLRYHSGELDDEDYLEYNSQRQRPSYVKGKSDPLTMCISDAESDLMADLEQHYNRNSRAVSITPLTSMPGSPECHVDVVLESRRSMLHSSSQECYSNYQGSTPNLDDSESRDSDSATSRKDLTTSTQTLPSQSSRDLDSSLHQHDSLSSEDCGPLPDVVSSKPTLPMSMSLSRLPSESSANKDLSVGLRSSRTAPPCSFIRRPSSARAARVRQPSSPESSALQCPAPPVSPESAPSMSNSSSQNSLSRHSLSQRTSSVDLPSVHGVSSSTSSRCTSIAYRRRSSSFHTSSSAGTPPPGSPPESAVIVTELAMSDLRQPGGGPRRTASVQSCSSATLSCHSETSSSGHTPSRQSCSPSYAPSVHSSSGINNNIVHSSPSTSSCYMPSPHSSPRHSPASRGCSYDSSSSSHSSPKHVAYRTRSPPNYDSNSPHCSPRHVPSCRSPTQYIGSPHTSPRHVAKASAVTAPQPGPSPHTSPRHVAYSRSSSQYTSSPCSSPRHVPLSRSSTGSSQHTGSPETSPRHTVTPAAVHSPTCSKQVTTIGHAPQRKGPTSPHHTPSPHSSPRRVISSSSTSSIQSSSPHTSPRHGPSHHHTSPRHVNHSYHSSAHSSPSPHSSPSRRLIYQTTPPPEVPPPAYEEALTMRVVQESPVHRPSTTTTTTTVAITDTELSDTTRSTTRRYTLRCMETSL